MRGKDGEFRLWRLPVGKASKESRSRRLKQKRGGCGGTAVLAKSKSGTKSGDAGREQGCGSKAAGARL